MTAAPSTYVRSYNLDDSYIFIDVIIKKIYVSLGTRKNIFRIYDKIF